MLAAVHLALGLLLTAEARRAIRTREGAWGADRLEAAREPGPQPLVGGPDYSAWRERSELWEDKQARTRHVLHVRLVSWGLGGAFAVQAVVLLVLLARAAGRSRREGAVRQRRAGPAGTGARGAR